MAWNLGSDARLRGGLWWVALGRVGYSRTSDSLNCVLGCVGTCRAKTVGYDLLFWFDVLLFLGGMVSGVLFLPGMGCIGCTGGM